MIPLSMNQRESAWRQRPLRVALGIALSLHIVGLGLFYVPGVLPDPREGTTLPVVAIADVNPGAETLGFAQLTGERRMKALPPPHSGAPALPKLLEVFSVITDPELDLAPPVISRHVEWQLSGPLADEKILNQLPSWFDEAPPLNQRLRYALQVDRKSGRVLWLYPLENITATALTTKVEGIIRQLHFAPRSSEGIAHGFLELSIYGETSS
jgi:hypothetical protein